MRKFLILAAAVVFWSACKFNGGSKPLPVYGNHPVGAFKFANQYGDSISNKDLDGKIYVADFFFTSCPSICPIMQRNMLAVYNAYKNNPDIKILSYTIDPKYDSVKVLKKYADKLGVSGNTWWFLRGDRDATYKLAEDSYLVAVAKDSTVAGGYVHQGYFVLVDKHARVRGSYDGTKPDQVSKLIADIKTLEAEKKEPAQTTE